MFEKLRSRMNSQIAKFLDFMSIRRKLTLSFLVVSVIPIVLVGVFSLVTSLGFQSASENQSFLQKTYISKLIWEDHDKEIKNIAEHLATDNIVIVNNELGLIQPIQDHLAETVEKQGISFGGLVDGLGNLVCTNSEIKYSLSSFPLSFNVGETEKVISMFAMLSGEELATLYNGPLPSAEVLVDVSLYPIHNYQGQFLGWIFMGDILAPKFSRSFDQMLTNIASKTKSAVSFFRGKQLVSSSDEERFVPGFGIEPPATFDLDRISPVVTMGLASGSYSSQYFEVGTDFADPSKSIMIMISTSNNDFLVSQILIFVGILLVVGFTLLVVVWAGRFLTNLFSKPIVAISEGAKEIISGNFEYRIPEFNHDEIGEMAANFNAMTQKISALLVDLSREVEEHQAAELQVRKLNEELEDRVEERTKELSDTNQALAASLSDLRKTQKHLLESEKLAAIGTLITGISHELNTPLGNLLTASTMLLTETDAFKHRFETSPITKTSFDIYLTQTRELSRVLSVNTQQMINKLSLFSKLSAEADDQSQSFVNLFDFVDNFTANLKSGANYGHVRFNNLISQDFQMKTWIGVLFQIYSHLSLNSLQHAFEGKQEPEITYTAKDESSAYELGIVDNGIGIAPDIQDHVFEPFFTTRMGNERSGLGLSIVHNIITKKLKGQITLTSSPGRGTSFFIRIPKSA